MEFGIPSDTVSPGERRTPLQRICGEGALGVIVRQRRFSGAIRRCDKRTGRCNPQTGQLLREHLHQARGHYRIPDEDQPKQTPPTTLQLLSRTDRAGAQIGALCRGMHQKEGETAVRRILGVLSLAKKYGAASVEDACAAALEVGICNYRFVRRYLERSPQLPLSLRQVDPLIRQLTWYRDFIESKTKESKT